MDTEFSALLDYLGYILYKSTLPSDFSEKMQLDAYVYYKHIPQICIRCRSQR